LKILILAREILGRF